MKHNTMIRSAHADKQLLRTRAPQPDESLMGYILRLSETNYYETPKWILDLAGLKIYSLKMGWRKLCDGHVDFTLFRQITRLSEEEVNEMRHKATRDIAQWDIPISNLRFNRPMVCSDCLRENSYCRKFWDLPVVTVCPRHHSLLLDICPNCRERITWNRKSVSRCNCGYDWREAGSIGLPPEQRQAMRLLMRACGMSESEQAPRRTSATPFEQLSVGDLSCVMLSLAHFVSVCEPGMDPLVMENRLLHQALEDVAAILDDWPEEFHFIPMEEAEERMGLSREWVNFLVSTGRLRGVASVSDPQTTLIDVKSIDKLSRNPRRLIGTRMAAAHLGITIKELLDLIAYGHLRIASGPQIDGCPDTALEVEALVNLYQSIKKISSWILETAIDLLSQSDSAELMSFDLRVTSYDYDIESVRLSHFAFRRNQIRLYLARHSKYSSQP